MKKDPNHIQIMKALGSLDTRLSVIETKQDDLIRRVGIQNGRVADSEAAIKKLVGEENYQRGSRQAAKYIIGLLLALAALVISLVALHAGIPIL